MLKLRKFAARLHDLDRKFAIEGDEGLRDIPIGEGEPSVLECLLRAKIPVTHSCGGMGICGTCRFRLISGKLEPRNEIEDEIARDRVFAPEERLACQTSARRSIKISLD